MLCPQCTEKVLRKASYRATTPACPKCRYQFVFFPNEEATLTDNLFSKKLKTISPDKAYFFTIKQLYYYILNAKAIEVNAIGCLSIVFIFLGFGLSFFQLFAGIPILIL